MPLDYNIEPFKEPKGFLKMLQWFFAICAFATTVNFSTEFSFSVPALCTPNAGNNTSILINVTKEVKYPFDLDQKHQALTFRMNKFTECTSSSSTLMVYFAPNAKSDAEFFVTTGVLTFLYATALIVVYLFANKLYTENTNAPIIDFVFTVILALFWLSGSAAWANGLSDLKHGTNPWNLVNDHTMFQPDGLVSADLVPVKAGSYGGIIISLLFGFINFTLWAANLWFLYKETTWFESILKNSGTSVTAPGSSA